MCGRFTLANEDWSWMLNYFGVSDSGFHMRPRYNIAPTQDVAAIVSDGRERRIGFLRWGLIPAWSETDKTSFSAFNARAETLTTRPAFKTLVSRKRCVIPADGFFEWHRGTRKPMRIRLKHRDIFGFAGLYDTWTSPDGTKRISSCTIITCKPNMMMANIHDRMPVILKHEDEALWLDRNLRDFDSVMEVLKPCNEEMYAYRVRELVGNVANHGPECIEKANV